MIHLDQKYHALLGEAGRQDTGDDAARLRLCFEVLALASAIDRDCAARLGAHGLSEGRFVLLFLLQDAPQGLSPHELAERAGVTRATITGLLDGLEREALVVREASAHDRRRLTVRLTPGGRRLAGPLFEEHARWISTLFAGLDPREVRQLSRLLAKAWLRTDAGRRATEGTSP